MKVNFTRNSDGQLKLENGNVLDPIILNFYEHYNPIADGIGWVDLPEGLVKGNVDFKGTTTEKKPLMDGKGNVIHTAPHVQYPGNPDDLNKKSLDLIDKYNRERIPQDFINGPRQPINVVYTINPDIDSILDQWSDSMLEDAFNKILSKLRERNVKAYNDVHWIHPIEQKKRIMIALGFSKRTETYWYHPLLGQDLEQNWLKFNSNTDNISQVTEMLFKSGFVKGQFKVRMDIKTALDLR